MREGVLLFPAMILLALTGLEERASAQAIRPPPIRVHIHVQGSLEEFEVNVSRWRVRIRPQDPREIEWILHDPRGLVESIDVNDDKKPCEGVQFPRLQASQEKTIRRGPFDTATPQNTWCRYNIVLRLSGGDQIIIDPDYRVDPP